MSEHLLIDPNELYKLYSYKNIQEYYTFDFLPEFTSIETDIFYDILNSISEKQLINFNRYLFKQWSLTSMTLYDSDKDTNNRKKEILSNIYLSSSYITKEQCNHKLKSFINNDKIMAIYVMNTLLKFLYPC